MAQAGEPSFAHVVFLLDLSESGTAKGDSGDLLKALRNRGIRTFTIEDAEEHPTPRGDEITPALVPIIQASEIAIVVATGGYRNVSLRRWSVLAYILNHFQRKPRFIIPVYYMDRSAAHRDPVDAFSLDGPKKYRMETRNYEYKWSKLMAQVDNLRGWDYNWYVMNKDTFNSEIASHVYKMLYRAPLCVADYPVGLESRLEEVLWHLNLTSSNREFLKMGFYGIPEGIHKSTLARAVYDSIAYQFEVSCFLPNIRENSHKHGLVGVQKMLLSEISGETEIRNVSEGASMIENMLLEKDVLLILDDVDSLDQLDALGRGPDWWFSDGSIVIITTREKGWLGDHENEFLLSDVQGALTTSQGEVSQISPSVSQTSPTDHEGSQTTRVAGVMLQSLQWDFQAVVWVLAFFVASGVGLLCDSLSPPFKRTIRGWTVFKFFRYVVFSLGFLAIILRSNQSRIFHRFKVYICFVIFLGISVYSHFYDKAVDGKPGILSLVSNAAFVLVALSLSKLLDPGFETGIFSYFLQCFTVQLITTDWKLIFVAIFYGGLLFRSHFSSGPFLFRI